MNLVGLGGTSHGDPGAGNPLPDVRGLLAEAASAGLDPRRDAFISFHLRFADRSGWERAGQAAAETWDVSTYSRSDAHMLRLSRSTPLTETAVEQHRAEIVAFAADNDGAWESVTVEDPTRASTWKAIAAQRLAADDELAAHDEAEPVVVRLAGDGDGNEVA